MPLSYQHIFVPGTDPKAPPLLLLHGTGGDEHDLVRLGHAVSPGSALISPRGDVSENGNLRFFRRFREGVFDLDDVRRRTAALAEFVAESQKQYGFPAQRLIAFGLSNGANIAATLLQLHPQVVAGAILFRAMVVLDQAPVASLQGKAVLMSNGRQDPIIPPDQPPKLAELFRQAGAAVSLQWQDASHGLVSSDVVTAQAWLSETMPLLPS